MARMIGLVTTSRRRHGTICQAREQFDRSPVFRRARDFCERAGMEWYILSASHILLAPRQVIGPDEPPLQTLEAAARLTWAEALAARLRARQAATAGDTIFVLYASQRYADLLARVAPDIVLEQPLGGLGLRERLRWFDTRLAIRPRMLATVPSPGPPTSG